jgi:hypothetical protein
VAGEDFMDLLKAGRIEDARKLLKAEMEYAKTAPDTLTQNRDGTATFKHRGKIVERDADGNWHFAKNKKTKSKKRRG